MTTSKAEPRGVARWRAVAFLTLSIVTALMAIGCASQPATPAAAQHEPQAATPSSASPGPQVCVSVPTQPSTRFPSVHGYITYADATDIWAAARNHPASRISLGSSHSLATYSAFVLGLSPIACARAGIQRLVTHLRSAGSPRPAQARSGF